MIKIKAFEILNYRSCLKTKLELPQDLICLIGINGVGKTNILNAIQLLKKARTSRSALLNRSDIDSQTAAKISVQLDYAGKSITVNCNLIYETDDRNQDEVLGGTVKFNLKQFTGKGGTVEMPVELFSYLQNPNFANSYIQNSRGKIGLTEKNVGIVNEIWSCLTRTSYFSASQFADPSKSPISIELDESRPIRQHKSGNYHEKFLNDLYLTYKGENKVFEKYLNTVGLMGMGIVETISFAEYEMPSSSYEVKSGGKIKKIERNRKLIIPYVNIENTQLSLNQLSEGTYRTLALVFYIITDNTNLLIIEEPEVCVHHGLLSSIIALLENAAKTKQVIISTHSDLILDSLSPENILIVKKTANEGTSVSTLAKSLTHNDYKALKKYLADAGNLGEYWKEGGFENE